MTFIWQRLQSGDRKPTKQRLETYKAEILFFKSQVGTSEK